MTVLSDMHDILSERKDFVLHVLSMTSPLYFNKDVHDPIEYILSNDTIHVFSGDKNGITLSTYVLLLGLGIPLNKLTSHRINTMNRYRKYISFRSLFDDIIIKYNNIHH